MRRAAAKVPRLVALLLLCALCLSGLCVSASSRDFPEAPTNSYIADEAGVISRETTEYVNDWGSALEEACGAQIAFAVVEFTGGYAIDDYTYELFNAWGVGDREKDNGILFVLAIGAEDYYAMPGEGLTRAFNGGKLQSILDDAMEPDFAVGDYDAAVRATFDATYSALCELYDLSEDNPTGAGYEGVVQHPGYTEPGPTFSLRTLLFRIIAIAVVVLIIWLIIAAIRSGSRRRNSGPMGGVPGGYAGGAGNSGFWSGMFLGSLLNRSRRAYRRPPPPPPPPPGGPGFGGFRGPGNFGRPQNPGRPSSFSRPSRPSGFGGGRPSGGGFGRTTSRPSGGGRGFGGFGGGSSRGGGAGRRR